MSKEEKDISYYVRSFATKMIRASHRMDMSTYIA